MEVKDLLEEVRTRFDRVTSISLDPVTGSLNVWGADSEESPSYQLKFYEHYSDITRFIDHEETWE